MVTLLNRIVKHPWLAMIVIITITGFFFFMMAQKSRMETDLDKYMPQQHPAFVYSNQAEELFGIQDGIIIAIERKDGIYHADTIKKIKKLTREIQSLPEINKNDVVSLYTAENIVGTEDGLDVKDFFRRVPRNQAELDELRANIRQNDMIQGRLVSDDDTVTVLIAEIEDGVFSESFYEQILDLAKNYEGPEKIYVAGSPIVEGTMARLSVADMKRMVPIVILVIVVVLALTIRSLKATIFTLLVVLFSIVWTFGAMATLNIPIYAVSTMIPVMLIAIGVAYGIHLYSHLNLYVRDNPAASKQNAITDMIREMWKPVVMTSVTTAIGFVSLVSSQVYPIKYFGVFTAWGVLSAMVFSLILIPSGILIFGIPRWKPSKIKRSTAGNSFGSWYADKIVKHKIATFFITALIIVVSLLGMRQVWINSSFLEKFEPDSDIVITDQFINSHFGGTSNLNVILEANAPDTFKQPEVLKLLGQLQQSVDEKLMVVGNSFSLVDYIKRMNKVMHADDDAFYSIPDSRNMIAQYLLLYEMSGDPENLLKVVDYGYQTANLTFQLKSDNSKAIKSVLAEIDAFVPEFRDLDIEVRFAGSGYKALVFTDLILEGQVISLIVSIILVVILLSIMFKKLTIGLIGAVPISLTAIISFGVMGLLDIPLSTTTALISSIAVGIGIDYAVHFIERYRLEAQSTGDQRETIIQTIRHSGRAIVFNAIVVIAGFMVLMASVFPPNRTLGALVSLNMFTSFLGTVTVMLILLTISKVFFSRENIE